MGNKFPVTNPFCVPASDLVCDFILHKAFTAALHIWTLHRAHSNPYSPRVMHIQFHLRLQLKHNVHLIIRYT